MDDTTEKVRETLATLGMNGWGLTPADHEGFTCAASMFLAYQVTPEADPLLGGDYHEATFHGALIDTRERGFEMIERLGAVLDETGIRHWTVPRGQDPDTLHALFSAKRAAALAGLGWIGKCSLLVTPRHGPRVVLFTVLMDLEVVAAPTPLRPACGKCTACIDACPEGYLSGADWLPGIERAAVIDAFACSRRMEELGVAIGHKHSCGLCLLACPLGAGQRPEKGKLPGA
jgi:epoxyqueuosine reductase